MGGHRSPQLVCREEGGHFTWDDGELSRHSTARLLASPDFPHHRLDQLIPQVEETRKFLSLMLLLKPDQSLEAFVGPSRDPLRNLKQRGPDVLPQHWVVNQALGSAACISRASCKHQALSESQGSSYQLLPIISPAQHIPCKQPTVAKLW